MPRRSRSAAKAISAGTASLRQRQLAARDTEDVQEDVEVDSGVFGGCDVDLGAPVSGLIKRLAALTSYGNFVESRTEATGTMLIPADKECTM